MPFDLKDKAVFLTGASSGLGEALALELARAGAKLALASRDQLNLERVAAACRAAGAPKAQVYALDVTKAADAERAVHAAQRDLGGLDVLINNAGVHAFSSVAEMPEGLFREALEVNLFGPLRLIQAALPSLRQAQGMVVNIGSNLSFRGIPTGGAYSASKGALARLTEALRDEEARNGVHVLHACPGVVLTKLRDNALTHKVEPQKQEDLPFPRTAEATAKDIVKAIRAKKREVISAAFPVKIWAKVLAPWFGGMLDKKMRMK
jgi:short-subunit dehydrogenase